MAQRALIADSDLIDVSPEADPVVAAALGNGGLAGFLPLQWRGRLAPGESVLILGATGNVGRIAVQVARVLGAGCIVAAGRDKDGLRKAEMLGADASVILGADASVIIAQGSAARELTAAFRDAAGGDVDIIVDYIAGALAESALSAASAGCRYVQVGSPVGDHITVSALTMRHLGLEMLGYAGYRTPLAVRRAAFARLNQLACDRQIDVDVSRVALDDLPSAWESTRRGSPSRQVVVP